jgi:hypothetical protein
MQDDEPGEIVLYHNQRKTVLEVLEKASKKTGRKLLEKDISMLPEDQIVTKKFEDNLPNWIEEVFKKCEKCAYTLYLREFHHAPKNVKHDVMNLMIKRELEGRKFPANTLIVLGVQDEDDVTNAIARARSVKFYRQP